MLGMSIKPQRMTDFSYTHAIICCSSNLITICTCDGISQEGLITRSILVMSAANAGQLRKINAGQVLRLVHRETGASGTVMPFAAKHGGEVFEFDMSLCEHLTELVNDYSKYSKSFI